jgi:hypothetical protein
MIENLEGRVVPELEEAGSVALVIVAEEFCPMRLRMSLRRLWVAVRDAHAA